jgi:hypothetical protein
MWKKMDNLQQGLISPKAKAVPLRAKKALG